MSITFLKYNGPKKTRNGSTDNAFYGSSKIYSTTGGGDGTSVSVSGFVSFSGIESISGVKNFENGITFGSPIKDENGNFYFGNIDNQTGVGGSFKYDASTDMLVSTLPISAPNIGGNVYLYSQIDGSLGLTDISTGGYFNAYTTQTIHKRLYAAEQITNCFEFDASLNAVKCKFPFYSVSWVSAGGANNSTPSSSSGSVTVHSWSDIGDYFSDNNTTATFNAYSIQKIYQMIQSTGVATITYDDVIDALGFTPADSSAVVENLSAEDISTALGYIPADANNVQPALTASDISAILGYIPANADDLGGDLTASDISTALGYIPADIANVLNGLSSTDITNALGFIPYDSANPMGYLNANDFKTVNNQSIIGSGNITINVDTTNIDNAINDVSVRVAVNTSNINDISTRLFGANNGLSDKIDDISTRVSNNTTNIANNTANITNNAAKINDVSARVGNISGNISDISARVAQNAASITNLGNQITGINTKITDISTRLYAMESNPLWEHFHYDSARNAVYTDTNFYSMGWSSAGGIRAESSSGSGSGSVTVHSWNDISDYYSDENTTATFNAYTIQRIYQMAQTAGSVQSIGYNDVIDALGYTPADSSAIQNLTASDISTALGYIPADSSTVMTNITSTTVTNALGYTPYNASNPAGYITANDISGFITGGDISSLVSKGYVDNAVSGLKTYVDASIARIDSSLDVMDSSITAIINSIGTTTGSIAEQLSQIDSSLDVMDSSITAIINNIGSINTTTGSISDSLDLIDGSIAMIDSSIAGIYTDIQNMDSSISVLDNSINIIDSSLATVQTAIDTMNTGITNIQTAMANLDGIDVINIYGLSADARRNWYTKFVNGPADSIENKVFKIMNNTVVQFGTETDASSNTNVMFFTNEYDRSLTTNKFVKWNMNSSGYIWQSGSFSAISTQSYNKEGIINKLGYTPYDGSTNPLNFLTSSDLPDYTFQTVDFSLTTRADRVNIYLGNMDSQNYIYEYSYPSTASDASVMPYRIVFSTQSIIDDGSTFTKIFTSVYYNPITDRWETFKYNLLPTGLFTTEKGYLSPDSSASLGAYAEISKINTINGQSLYSPTGSVDLVIDASTSVTSFKTINNESIVGTGNVQIDEGIPATFVNNIWVGTTAQLQANTLRDPSTLYITID